MSMTKVSLNCGCTVRMTPGISSWAFCAMHGMAPLLLGFIEGYRDRVPPSEPRRRAEQLIAGANGPVSPPLIAQAGEEKIATDEQRLALAVLAKDYSALLPLVDNLIEDGKLPATVSPNGEAIQYKEALQKVIQACREWSAGMDDIGEFIEARRLLGEIVDGE